MNLKTRISRGLCKRASPLPFEFMRRALGALVLARTLDITFGGGPDLLFGARSLVGPPPWPGIVVGLTALQLGSAIGLIVGRGRWSCVTAALAHAGLSALLGSSTYGVDQVISVTLFFLAVGPMQGPPTRTANLTLLALRGSIMLLYVSSGIEKASGPQWLVGGEAVWRAVMRPDLASFDAGFLAEWQALLVVAALATLFLEITYPAFMGWRRTRKIGLAAVICFHGSIAAALGLWYFSLTMVAVNLACWLPFRTFKPRAPAIAVFDGDCSRCTRWVGMLSRASRGRLEAVAASDPRARVIAPSVDLGREMALAVNGRVLAGAEAFLGALAAALSGRPWVGRWLERVGRTALARRVYSVWAQRRRTACRAIIGASGIRVG